MTRPELATKINDLYPELLAVGTLSQALDNALTEIGSPLHASEEMHFIPLAYARVADGSRFCQVYIAAHERLFLLDFWNQGITYGNASCSSLNDTAQAIHCWIVDQPDLAEMQDRFSFFVPNDQGRAHEAGRTVECQWETLRQRWARNAQPDALSPLPLIEAASKHAVLRQLFPFTSLFSLHFSRTTGYPFTIDCPFAVPLGNGRFRAHAAAGKMGEIIGEGDAEEVIAMVIANLPPDCGPAVAGTSEDLSKRP